MTPEIFFLLAQTWLLKGQSTSTLAQLKLLQKEIKDDHERSRREIAINLMLTWAEHLKRDTSAARKLVEELTDKQCVALFEEKQLELPANLMPLIVTCLGSKPALEENNGHVVLKESEVAVVRWEAVRFLNTLEVVMAAWRHNTADREMIAEQFQYLVDLKKGHMVLEKFRQAAGGNDAFPAIGDFATHVKKEREQAVEGKKKLGKTADEAI